MQQPHPTLAILATCFVLGAIAEPISNNTSSSAVEENAVQGKEVQAMRLLGAEPFYPVDSRISKHCTFYFDALDPWSCQQVIDETFTDADDFYRWNPVLTRNCDVVPIKMSYCTEAYGEPEPSSTTTTTTPKTTTTTKKTTTTTKPPATTTTAGNGIKTPEPTKPGMVNNCNKFHLVKDGDGCNSIIKKYGISIDQLAKWNDIGGTKCTSIWLDTHVCVGIIGQAATTTTKKPATTTGNGIKTPTPTKPGMVNNCNKFHLVKDGDGCDSIIKKYGITIAQLAKWNDIGGTKCTSLWLDTQVCVGIIGQATTTTKKTTTTTKGNGVTTPTPTQSGIVNNCKKFYKAAKGQTCDDIVKAAKITLANFKAWNKGIGSDCKSLWADTYHCVGV